MNEQERLNALTAPLLTWYDIHKRVLPWRGIRDPYRIWVSEIMLQQTRVQAVLEYYARFMAELPDVYALAAVGEERLFKLWEGLGYYSRARNLHRAAQVLVNDCGGEFHRTREEVMYLVHLVDDCGIPVMCYGLRADFRGELFPGSYELLVMADKLEEVKTICWCGKKAAFNARFDANGKVLKEGEQVVLGANDQYIGLCRRHWMAGDLGPDFNGQGTGD